MDPLNQRTFPSCGQKERRLHHFPDKQYSTKIEAVSPVKNRRTKCRVKIPGQVISDQCVITHIAESQSSYRGS